MSRAKDVARAVLPPCVNSAARHVRRHTPVHRSAFWPDQPLRDGDVELRLIDKRDLDMIQRAARDPEIRRQFRLLRERPREYFERWREASRNDGAAAFAICDTGGECLGLVTVELHDAARVELGYWLLPEGRGRGRATRALRLVSRWLLSRPGIARLELATSPGNTASLRVAELAGFQREGILRSYHVIDGRREDKVCFSLLPDDARHATEPRASGLEGGAAR